MINFSNSRLRIEIYFTINISEVCSVQLGRTNSNSNEFGRNMEFGIWTKQKFKSREVYKDIHLM